MPELAHYLLEDARRRPLRDREIGPAAQTALRAFARGDGRDEIASALGAPGLSCGGQVQRSS